MVERDNREAQDRRGGREAREAREARAMRHVSVMKAAFGSEIRAAIEGAHIVEAGYAAAPESAEQDASTRVSFAPGNVVNAIFQAEKPVAVLDNASYRYPGGGYLRGWSGPEEDLCDESDLYPILEAFQKEYYNQNKQTASGELYTSRALAIPEVRFTRNGEIASCSVCVMAAPNRKRALERNRSERECDMALAERVEAALDVLAAFGAQTVILPAFGCGQAGNDAAQVAQLIRGWIDRHDGVIPQVVFALWRGPDEDAFKRVFADKVQEEEAPAEEAPIVDDEDSGESDWEKYRISE